MAEPFDCSVVTPEAAVFDDKVVYANVPAHDGQIGFLNNHAPLLAQLGEGDLHLELPGGGRRTIRVHGGFAQMNDNRLTLVTEKAVDAAAETKA